MSDANGTWWCCSADYGKHEPTCKNYVAPTMTESGKRQLIPRDKVSIGDLERWMDEHGSANVRILPNGDVEIGPPHVPIATLGEIMRAEEKSESGKQKEERVPEVAGRTVSTSLAELEHRLRHYILREQKEHRFDQDNGLLELLSECVRLSREYADHMNGGSHD